MSTQVGSHAAQRLLWCTVRLAAALCSADGKRQQHDKAASSEGLTATGLAFWMYDACFVTWIATFSCSTHALACYITSSEGSLYATYLIYALKKFVELHGSTFLQCRV